jgi:hypothetical protein
VLNAEVIPVDRMGAAVLADTTGDQQGNRKAEASQLKVIDEPADAPRERASHAHSVQSQVFLPSAASFGESMTNQTNNRPIGFAFVNVKSRCVIRLL